MPAGRPTKYTPEIVDEVYKFFDIPLRIEQEREFPSASGRVVTIKEQIANDFPSIEAFAAQLYVGKATIYRWAKVHEEFRDALDWARIQQQKFLLTLGLKNEYAAGMVKFLLINTGDYKDKIEQEINHTGEVKLQPHDESAF